MKIRNNQKGIAHLMPLLLVVVIAVIGFVGWKVWDNSKKDSTSTSTIETTSANNSSAPSPATTKSFTYITEWGMKVENPQGDTISYSYNEKTDDYPANLEVRTKRLDELSGSCKDNSVFITRGTANQTYSPAVLETPSSTFKQAYNYQKSDSVAGWYSVGVKVGEYYYLVTKEPGTTCSNNVPQEEATWASIGKAFNGITVE